MITGAVTGAFFGGCRWRRCRGCPDSDCSKGPRSRRGSRRTGGGESPGSSNRWALWDEVLALVCHTDHGGKWLAVDSERNGGIT